jgi:hypothetical protein
LLTWQTFSRRARCLKVHLTLLWPLQSFERGDMLKSNRVNFSCRGTSAGDPSALISTTDRLATHHDREHVETGLRDQISSNGNASSTLSARQYYVSRNYCDNAMFSKQSHQRYVPLRVYSPQQRDTKHV